MKRFSMFATLFFSFFYPTLVQAHHAGPHPEYYVAPHGSDDSDCTEPEKPCRTLEHALMQAGKGDRVLVSTGTFPVSEQNLFYLITGAIHVEGGFLPNFSGKANKKTVLTGVPSRLRALLAKKGFRIIQDKKHPPVLPHTLTKAVQLYQKLQMPALQANVSCQNQMADDFPCHNIDLVARVPLSAMRASPSAANDIWGFVDLNNQREYALLGLDNGVAIFDLSEPSQPKEVATIAGKPSIWRDIKVYQYYDHSSQRYHAYAYVTTEAPQGLQIIDLSGLPDTATLVATLTDFQSAHNLNISGVDPASGVALNGQAAELHIAGSDKANGVFRIYRLDDPVQPTLVSTGEGTGSYMHDSASILLDVSDARISQCQLSDRPCRLMADFSEDTIDLWDITTPNQPILISRTNYTGVGYVHSGSWSEDGRYLFVQDELDELQNGQRTTLRVFDVLDLRAPILVSQFVGPTSAIDHNGFVHGHRYYMSNYRRGLTVLDISNPLQPVEIGYFDTFPVPAENTAQFDGAWGTFPYLPSGHILVSDITYGLFVLKLNESTAPNPPAIQPDKEPRGGGGSAFGLLLVAAGYIWARKRRYLSNHLGSITSAGAGLPYK